MKIRITIPSDPAYLELIRNLVKQSMPSDRFETVTVDNIVQAIDEACSNVIEHSYEMKRNNDLSMTIDSDDEKVAFLIEDTGIGINVKEVKKPDVEEYVRKRMDGGFGRYIIANVMDEVKYSRRGKKNRLRLVKYFNGKDQQEEV